MYALHLDKNTNRIQAATFPQYATLNMPIVEELPEGNLTDYLYENKEYVYDPIEEETPIITPSTLDKLEAQVVYTAMMTDTLLEEV